MNSHQACLQFQIGKVLDKTNSTLAYRMVCPRAGEEASTSAHTNGFSKALVKPCR